LPRYLAGTDRCSSDEYRCTHVDACVARTWISYRCVRCHPWCTHRTPLLLIPIAIRPFQFGLGFHSNISSCQKNFFSFPVAVNNSIKVGPLVFVINVCNHGEHYETPRIMHCNCQQDNTNIPSASVSRKTAWQVCQRHVRKTQQYALIFTTPLFYVLAPTCFGSNLPSSGSVLDPSELLEIQSEWAVYLKYITD
jgi:hypothetical protein